jgi:hypothetical protein
MMHDPIVVHHIPGRLRRRLPQPDRSPRLMGELGDFVAGLGGVQSIKANALTGSILVLYHPEWHGEMLALFGEPSDPPANAAKLPGANELRQQSQGPHSELALQIICAFGNLNQEVRAATDNAVDLKVLLPLALVGWALLKMSARTGTPFWVTLALSAFNSFTALHRQPDLRATAVPVGRIGAYRSGDHRAN